MFSITLPLLAGDALCLSSSASLKQLVFAYICCGIIYGIKLIKKSMLFRKEDCCERKFYTSACPYSIQPA